MDLKTPYAFGKIVEMTFAEAELKVREELAKEGFGVLTEIDIKKKFPRSSIKNSVTTLFLVLVIPPSPMKPLTMKSISEYCFHAML